MAILKKNIWLIFYVLAFCATALFLIASYFKWQSTYSKYQISQENIVEIMANATHSLFDTQERLMDILGVSIFEDQHHLYETQSVEKHSNAVLQNQKVILSLQVHTKIPSKFLTSSDSQRVVTLF